MAVIDFKVPPVIKTVSFPGPADQAFDRFTLEIGKWWPLATHSIGRDAAASVGFDRLEIGGALVERCDSGDQHIWGSIVAIDRPSTISFTWHVGRQPDTAQRIDMTFEPARDDTTRVTLCHSGWEHLGDKALEAQQSYDLGWEPVLARYAGSGGE